MPQSVSVILHFNIDYAEIPRNELPNVVRTSYEPMIKAIEEWSGGTACLNLTGHTIEFLQSRYPELITKIKSLVDDGVIELLATGYSHPILPLLPPKRIKRQIQDHVQLVKDVFNQPPKGAWPPELAVNPFVLKVFQDNGIDWIGIDHEHYMLAQTLGNDFNPFERREPTSTEVLAAAYWSRGLGKLRAYWKAYQFLMRKNKEFKITLARVLIRNDHAMKAVLMSASMWNSTQLALSGAVPIYSKKKHIKLVLKHPATHLPLYTSDVEFFGYRELGIPPPKPRALFEFLKDLQREGIEVKSPSHLEENAWNETAAFLGSGSWAPDKSFRIWTESEDNRTMNAFLSELYAMIETVDLELSELEQVERWLRIAENSDARGWAPLPERKHEAYSAMMSLYQFLEAKGGVKI